MSPRPTEEIRGLYRLKHLNQINRVIITMSCGSTYRDAVYGSFQVNKCSVTQPEAENLKLQFGSVHTKLLH